MIKSLREDAWTNGMIRTMRFWEWLLLVAGLLLFALQAGLSSPHKSAAFDEQYHITRGYAYLETGDFRLSQFHPPLLNLLSALPLLWRNDVVLPTDHPAWENGDNFIFAHVFLWQANENPHDLLVWARWPMIGLGLLLLLILFFWARQMVGRRPAWLVLGLAALDPNLIANARLVATDLGLAVMLTLALWRTWCWLKRPSSFNLILLGIAAGLTMSAKYTGLVVWPILFLILLLQGKQRRPALANRSRPLAFVFTFTAVLLVAYVTVWAIFRFDVGRVPVPALAWLPPIPAPYYFYSVWDTFLNIEAQPKTSFLLGEISSRGWWYYFPVALLVKTPLPLLLLALVGSWLALWREGWRETAVLWLPPLLFMGLAMTGRITIGYRHILPLVPFLIMLAAYSLKHHDYLARGLAFLRVNKGQDKHLLAAGLVIGLLLLGQALMVIRLYPHHESFFNLLVGGPSRGDRVLVDSNIDWGQDLITLRRLMDEMEIERVYLAYFGAATPERYGVRYYPIPGFLRFVTGPEIDGYNPYSPPPGWYAISVTSLRLGLLEQNLDMYAFFGDKEPVARAGYSINLYYVDYPKEMPLVRTAVSQTAVSDISPEQLGLRPGHRLITKWSARPEIELFSAGEVVYPHTFQPLPDISFGPDLFALSGYVLPQTTLTPGEMIELVLYWQVETADFFHTLPLPAPTAASPLAAFIHLSGQDPGDIVAQYDGWDVALTGLESGDVIRYPVTLTVPSDTPSGTYYLRLGLYMPQSGARLPAVTPTETADWVTLPPITVR
jgi:4-amino-4-deoxy-L-arabinose transferase-like glycosyltransferase